MTIDETDVAIVGPGPYGLSVAAQLRSRGVSCRVFGPPMKFSWDMPRGINLKSFAFATNLAVPESGHTFPEWCRARGLEDLEPCSMESFATYGLWIKDRFVSDVDPRPRHQRRSSRRWRLRGDARDRRARPLAPRRALDGTLVLRRDTGPPARAPAGARQPHVPPHRLRPLRRSRRRGGRRGGFGD